MCPRRLSPQCPKSPEGRYSWYYVWSVEYDCHLHYHCASSSWRKFREKEGKKSISSVVLYCWFCPSKVILQKKKTEKLIKLMRDTSKPLICCGHHFLFWDVLYGENYHPPPHQAVRSMFCIGLGVKDSHWPVKSVLSTPLNKFVWQFSTLQQLSVFRHI